jgi:signal transduction histidine kinase
MISPTFEGQKVGTMKGGNIRAELRFLANMISIDSEAEKGQAWIIEETRQILDAKCVSLYLYDNSKPDTLNKLSQSTEEQFYSQLIPFEGNQMVLEVLEAGKQHRIVEDNVIYSPLAANEETIGVIEVEFKSEMFDADMLAAIGESIARNVTRSRQSHRAQEKIQAMQTFQDQLLNSRNTLRALFDSSPSSIYIIDPAYSLVAINMRRADLASQVPQELVGKRCFSVLHQRETPCPGCLVGKTFQTGDITRRIEHRGMGKISAIEHEISTFPIWDHDRQVMQAFLFEEDVTERQHMQATLAQSEKLAAVGQLAAGVAHEINNPLTIILANTQLLQRSLPARDEDLQDMAELIIQATERASQAVRDLLDFARRERYELAPTDLNETIHRTLALIGHELGTRTISLQFDPTMDLPTVNASQDHLQGVWLNLLINAIDAIEQGPGVISIKTSNTGESVHVSITDDGVGIPPEEISRIFEPFYTTKKPGRGTGLGLAVCHQIVTRHGGQILVESQPDQGTTFTIILPLS